jgi:transcriptional regulator with XRE-family HTH domain
MASLGQELRRERELRGISLREIADSTRISLRFLQAIEDDQFGRIPGEFFVRAILRSYAKGVGLDEHQVLNRYQEMQSFEEQQQERENKKETAARNIRGCRFRRYCRYRRRPDPSLYLLPVIREGAVLAPGNSASSQFFCRDA